MLYNAFLDGDLLGRGPGVGHNAWVNDPHYGATLEWWRLRLSYTRLERSAEFGGQSSDGFGAVTLGMAVPLPF